MSDGVDINGLDLPADYFLTDPRAEDTGYGNLIDPRSEDTGYGGEITIVDPRAEDTGYGGITPYVDPRAEDTGYGGVTPVAKPGAFDEFKNALSKLFGSSYTGKDGSGISGLLGNLGGVLGSKVGMAGLLALLSYLDRQKGKPATGGGTAMGYTPPAPAAPGRVVQGRYGPIMQYAGGGMVQMEDGGFVMTKRAVDGAGGPAGIRQLIPAARMIRGPGTGTSDSIAAVIKGRGGDTPAAVSNGEAYVPKKEVDRLGGAQKMYGMMRQLTKKAR